MRLITKWMLALTLLIVCIGVNAEKKYLSFSTEDYCAAKWNAETNTLTWGSGGWNSAWTFMAAKDVSGDLSAWEKLHLNAKNFTNSKEEKLTVVFKKNDGSNPPSGPTKEFVVSPDANGDINIDLTKVEWGDCDITNIQDLTIYGGERTDATTDASVVVTDAYLEKASEDVLPIDIQFGADYNNESVSSYSKAWTATKDGKTWTITNFNNNSNKWNSIKCGSKNAASVASITSPAINAEVKAYVISLAAAANVNSAKLTIMNGEAKVGEDIDITEKFVAGEVVVPVEGQKGYSYVLTIDNAQGSANGSVEITKITLAAEVKEPVHIANTAETAYTVAKAIELIDAGEALTETVFVKGIVSKVDEYNDQYKNITYWISADGTTESAQFECYRGKGIDGADFASIEDVKVGATVIVKGTLKKFGEIYEFNQNNELVSYEAPAEPASPILTLKGTVGEEATLTFGVWDTEDTFSVDFGDGQLQSAKVGINNAGPVKEDGNTGSLTKFTGTVAGDGTIKVYGNNDIWYINTTGGVMPTTLDQTKLMNVVQMTITGADVEKVELPAYPKMTQFNFNNSSVKSVDVSKVTTLTSLSINSTSASKFEPQLESIDLSKNTELDYLSLQGNTNNHGKLQTLDLSANTKLTKMYVQYNQIKSVTLPEGAALSFINIQDNNLESIDLTTVESIKDTYLSNNKLAAIDLSKMKAASTLNIDGNKLATLTVPVSIKTLNAKNNELTSVSLVDVTTQCNLDGNKLTLATIPAQPASMNTASKAKKFTYAPQAALQVAESLNELDLTAQLTVAKGELNPEAVGETAAYGSWIENKTTTFSFVTESGTALVESTDYEVTEPGKFKFLTAQTEKVHGVMLNAAFPKFTEATPFTTTEFTVALSTVPVIAATLEHTASSYCEADVETYLSKVDAETEHVNNSAFNATWQGAAYAEFSFAGLPANATITEATLTFTGIGESRRARNTDVMLVNAGETLDYTALTAGNAKVNLDATTIQSVSFPKGSSEVFNIDATEQLNALVAGGQRYAIFKFTNNPGGGDIAGKASTNAPTLVITYALGAPAIANASFDANAEDIITVTTQGYQRNIPEGSDQISGLQPVTGWTPSTQTESDPGYVGGIFAYGSENLLNNKVAAPATAPEGSTSPSALGLAAVWGGIAQYTQEVTAPAGDYKLSYTVYNGINTGAVTKNLFGFIAADGTEYLSDVKTFTVGEWATYDVTFTLAEETTGKISVGFIGSGGSGNAPHLFVDNVKLEKVAGIEVALKDLEKAIAAAQAKAATYTVGDGLFMYATSEIEPLNTAVATAQAAYTAAESKAAVEAATATLNAFVETFAPVATLPAADKAYTFELRLGGETPLYMALAESGVTIAEEATPLKFIAVEGANGQYNLANEEGTLFVGLDGSDAWTMSTLADKKAAWTFTALPDGAYHINNLVTAGRFVGTNAADKEAGKPCYADKKTDNGNVDWIIAEYVAPAAPHTWDFTKWSEETVTNLKADAAASKLAGWSDVEKKADAEADANPTEVSKDNCFWYVGGEAEPTANGTAIAELAGLEFNTTYGTSRALAIAVNYQVADASKDFGPYNGPSYLWFGGKNQEIMTIKNVKAGTLIKMGVESHKITDARGLQLFIGETALTDPEGAAVAAPKTYTEQTWAVPAGEGVVNVVVKNTNGCHIYFIDAEIGEAPTPVVPDDPEIEVAEGWHSVIANGNLATDNVANFFSKENGGDPVPSTIVAGAGKNGSRGIVINTNDNPSADWDAQFFIQANENIPAGYKIHVEFDYMATQEAEFDTQSHAEPGNYIHWYCVDSYTAKPEWQHMSKEVEVSAANAEGNGEWGKACTNEANGKPFKTVAFNLSKVKTATTFYFDNIAFWVSNVATGIQNIKSEENAEKTIYNLNGQKVNKAQKGLFIINGKKVVVK